MMPISRPGYFEVLSSVHADTTNRAKLKPSLGVSLFRVVLVVRLHPLTFFRLSVVVLSILFGYHSRWLVFYKVAEIEGSYSLKLMT